MRRVTLVGLALAVLVVVGGGDVRAAAPSEADYAVARSLFQRGQQHFRAGEYGQALVDFTDAYRAVPQPALLYNIAQCDRELGRFEEALRQYRAYLDATRADDPERPAIEARIAEVERHLAERDRAQRLDAAHALTAAAPPRPRRALLYAGIGVTVAGVALVAAGGAPLASYLGARSDLEAAAAARAVFDPSVERRMDAGRLGSGLLFGLGGAVAVTGAALVGAGAHRARGAR